jgi:hypothetical protein
MPDCTIGGDVGGERERRGDDLVAGRQVEQVDGEAQRRGPGVDHHAVPLGQQVGHAGLEGGDRLADLEVARPQDLDDGLDLLVVVDPSGRRQRHASEGRG